MMLRYLALATAALALPLMAGSFVLSLGHAPEGSGAIATVQLSHHAGVQDPSVLKVTAEGLVNGKRLTQPVRLASIAGKPNLRALHWTRPAEGTWVLKFSLEEQHRAVFAPVTASGVKPQAAAFEYSETDQTNAVLARLASTGILTAVKK